MNTTRSTRHALPEDYEALADVMFDAVRNGPSKYSEEQRQAWVPEVRSGSDWITRLSAQKIIVGEDEGRIVGFMTLGENGYVDLAFIRPMFQGTGLFRQLYRKIEEVAYCDDVPRLWVHASLAAHPAFTAVGFVTTAIESVEIRGQLLQRFLMKKQLQ